MRSSKSRSRNKNRSRSPQGGGNIVNRTFDSSGPEGKVRGTPAQIIDKYNQLARDAQLSGDRVAVENFQQHAEHYTRMLAAAQREIDARQQGNQGQQGYAQSNSGGHQGGQQGGGNASGHQNTGQQNTGQQQGGNAQGGGQDGGGQDSGGQDWGSQDWGSQDGGGQDGGGQNAGRQDAPPSPVQGRRQAGNRRREKPEARDADAPESAGRDARARGGDPRDTQGAIPDVIDAPEGDNGLVETPEARATDAPGEAKAEKPKRTRTRKKAPADIPSEPTSGS